MRLSPEYSFPECCLRGNGVLLKPNKISSYSLPRAGFFSALENLNSRKDVVEISELNFSQRVRNELARVKPTHPSCKWAELFGLIQTIGTLNISTRGPSLEIKTENAAVARKAVTLFKELGQMDSELIVEKETKLKKRNLYRIRVSAEDFSRIFPESIHSNILDKDVPTFAEDQECCRRSYLRGLFLGSGSVQNPEKTYHLEIRIAEKRFAERLKEFLDGTDLKFGVVERRNEFVLYIKDSDSVATFLTMVGAHSSLLHLENIRIIKDMKNNINRMVNCEDANIEKTITASVKQVQAIDLLEERGMLKTLPKSFQEVARVRKENFDASYTKIAEILEISKSAVSYRLKKIEDMAEKIAKDRRKDQEDEE
ncbi:MAG: DNA-binding protein WhiA [Bacillota bacterium]|jgi:DNA-binding protein WhiA|nr:DNA-binding protein WhiA [Bacillota bacterium]HOA91632.1 DNA-binding protein WhiA [Bacillota bacterium]HPZ73673.1 DNA-binding protein WhiA [Bacillota bacterium]HQD78624.1 DNA-binding protein WhiA [Bacillota bacterium]